MIHMNLKLKSFFPRYVASSKDCGWLTGGLIDHSLLTGSSTDVFQLVTESTISYNIDENM